MSFRKKEAKVLVTKTRSHPKFVNDSGSSEDAAIKNKVDHIGDYTFIRTGHFLK